MKMKMGKNQGRIETNKREEKDGEGFEIKGK